MHKKAQSGFPLDTIKDILVLPITLLAEKCTNRFAVSKTKDGIIKIRKPDLLFTNVSEGTVKAIMRGGQFSRFVIAFEGKNICNQPGKYTVVTDNGDIEELDLELGDIYTEPKASKPFFGGYRWIGVPPNAVYTYRFKWRGLDIHGNPQEERIETIDYILTKKDVYYVEVKAAKTGKGKEFLPVDIGCLVTVRIVNPYKALFGAQNWLSALTNLIAPQVGDFVSRESYETLTTGRINFEKRMVKRLWNQPYVAPSDQTSDQLDENWPLRALNCWSFTQYMEKVWGARIEDFKIGQIRISREVEKGSAEEISLQKFINKMEQRGIIEKAKGSAKAVEISANAEAIRIKTITNAWQQAGKLGILIKTLEALEKSTAAFQYSINSIPQLRDLFANLGVSFDKSGNLSHSDLQELISILKNLNLQNK